MYLEHFGLDRPPFKITPDTSMFYSGNKRGAALEALKYAITSGEGIIKVVGEVGSGKTMLCRMLEVELDSQVEIVYIANPSLSPENILHLIAFELKLNITPDSSKLEVMQSLQDYLLQKHACNRQVVVFVEEAQSMPVETLEEIRLLSNLETGDYKLLQMVLFGQPELDEKLRQPSIRQLKERITHNFYLDPFPADDVYRYLNFRLRAVGYRGPDLFTRGVANRIERKSNGLTRRINILADKALLAAFSDGGHAINRHHIQLAAKDSDFGQAQRWQPVVRILLLITILLAAIWLGTQLAPLVNSPTVVAMPSRDAASQPEQAPIAAHTATSRPDSLLQQRLQQTTLWLNSADSQHYTLQLSLIPQDAGHQLNNYITKVSQQLNTNQLYIYPAFIGGSMVYSVLYNDYEQHNEASRQLENLPSWLRQSRPYIRTLKGIKQDISKTRSMTQAEAVH